MHYPPIAELVSVACNVCGIFKLDGVVLSTKMKIDKDVLTRLFKKGSHVKQQDLEEKMREYPMGLDSVGMIPPEVTIRFSTEVQEAIVLFKLTRLIIPAATAIHFHIVSFRIDERVIEMDISAESFSETATGRHLGRLKQEGRVFGVKVKNISDEPRRFIGVFIGGAKSDYCPLIYEKGGQCLRRINHDGRCDLIKVRPYAAVTDRPLTVGIGTEYIKSVPELCDECGLPEFLDVGSRPGLKGAVLSHPNNAANCPTFVPYDPTRVPR